MFLPENPGQRKGTAEDAGHGASNAADEYDQAWMVHGAPSPIYALRFAGA